MLNTIIEIHYILHIYRPMERIMVSTTAVAAKYKDMDEFLLCDLIIT